MGLRRRCKRIPKTPLLCRKFLRCDANMQASRRREVLTGEASRATLTGAATESLAVLADEEVDNVLIAVVAIGDAVLPKDARCLDEEVACFCPCGGFG